MRFTVPHHLPKAGPELLVALDVDGTLMSHLGDVTARVADAVAALAATGTHEIGRAHV